MKRTRRNGKKSSSPITDLILDVNLKRHYPMINTKKIDKWCVLFSCVRVQLDLQPVVVIRCHLFYGTISLSMDVLMSLSIRVNPHRKFIDGSEGSVTYFRVYSDNSYSTLIAKFREKNCKIENGSVHSRKHNELAIEVELSAFHYQINFIVVQII